MLISVPCIFFNIIPLLHFLPFCYMCKCICDTVTKGVYMKRLLLVMCNTNGLYLSIIKLHQLVQLHYCISTLSYT